MIWRISSSRPTTLSIRPDSASAVISCEKRPSAVAAAVELADLRRELEATRRQRDILKKALAIVAQEDASATPSSRPFTTSSRA